MLLVPIYKKITLLWLVLMNPGMSVSPMRYTVLYDQSHVTFTNAQETLTFSGEQIDAIVSSMPSDIQVNFVNGRWDWNRLADYVQDNNITPSAVHMPEQVQNNRHAPINHASQYHNNADKNHYMVAVAHVSESKLHKLYNHRNMQALQKVRDKLQSEIRWSYVTALFWPSVRKPMRELLAQAESYIQDIQDAMANNVNYITRHVSDQNSPRLRMILSTGSNHALQQKRNALLQESRTTWHTIKQDYAYNQAMHADAMLKEPITEILFTIMTADLARAQAEFNALKDSWPWYGGELCVSKQQAHEILQYIKRVGFNELQVAREIMQVRLSQEGPVKRKSTVEQKPSIAMEQDPVKFVDDGLVMVPSVASKWNYKEITQEVESRFAQALQRYNTEGQNFEQYHTEISNIVQDILPDVPESLIKRIVNRLNPKVQGERLAHLIPDLINLIYRTGMEMTEHAMPKPFSVSPVLDSIEGPVNSVIELVGGAISFLAMDDYDRAQLLEQMDWQQLSNFCTDISIDILVDYVLTGGIPELVNLLKHVDVAKRANNAKLFAQKVANKIAEHVAEVPKAVTPEGIAVKVGKETEQQMSLFQKVKDELVGSAQKAMSAELAMLEAFAQTILGPLEKEIECLRSMFDFKRKGFAEFANKWIKINYEHILGFNLEFSDKGIPRLGGLHHDIMNTIENSKSFKFVNKVLHENGCYKVDLWVCGVKFPEKTFFPASWSREKVVSKIYEAYDNFLKDGAKAILLPGEKYKCVGVTNEGIKIEFYLTKAGKMTTAYPKL